MKWGKIHLIECQKMSILEQLQLEEALLRTESKSFCLINFGSPKTIVMGISGKPETLLNLEKIQSAQVPILRRFSGGGTVVVDETTLFITFIFAKDLLPIPAFPEPIHRWFATFYAQAWNIPGFHYRENDYAINDRKCGGNAQYIKKDRWLHHTSFLWDYANENMDYLLLPSKRPQYRQDRSHTDFLCRISKWASLETLIEQLKEALAKQFVIETFDVLSWERKVHRQSVELLS